LYCKFVEHMLMSENKIHRKIFVPKRVEMCEKFRISHNGEVRHFQGRLVLLGQGNQGGHDELQMWLGWRRQEMHTECWWKNPLENAHFEVR
jgi:hypothetical protein